MSHSSPSGEPSSIPSPRTYQGKSGNDNTTITSRPGTSGNPHAEALAPYATIAPAGFPDSRPTQNVSRQPDQSPAQTPSRALGVHSILNPSSDAPAQSKRPIHGPSHGLGLSPTFLPPPAVSPRSRKRNEPTSPSRDPQALPPFSSGRRVLTPKSPRAASMGSRRNPPFHGPSMPLQPLTAPEPRIYTAEPGIADVPSLPSISSASRPGFGNFPTSEIPPYAGRAPLLPAGPPTGLPSALPPRSDSPSTSQTSQSQADQTSPAYRYGTTAPAQQQGYPGPPSSSIEGYPPDMSRVPSEGYQAGQSGYSMRLRTEHGHMVLPVEVDVQQASKVADEKRKRNAGASARFRARRKEKEKEASQTISSLQQDLRAMQDERDFYRNERDYFREYALRHVQLPPRPPSPQRTRPPTAMIQQSDETSASESIGRARSDSAPAAQRRRTGDYQPPFAGSQVPSPYSTGYAQPPVMPMPSLPPQPPASYPSPRSLPPGPSASQARPQPPYETFRRDSHDNNSRSWNPGR